MIFFISKFNWKSKNQLLQYARGIANTSKTKIIKIVQGYFLKMKNK
jgi:hypothetical protein